MELKFTLTLILPFVIVVSAYTPIGAPVDKDPSDVKYTLLAQEALIKYANDNGASTSYNVLQVTKASEQIVAGTLYRIDFFGVPTNCYIAVTNGCSVISCHAEIGIVPWLNQRDIKANCTPLAL